MMYIKNSTGVNLDFFIVVFARAARRVATQELSSLLNGSVKAKILFILNPKENSNEIVIKDK